MKLIRAVMLSGVCLAFNASVFGFNSYALNIENNVTIDFNETSIYSDKATPVVGNADGELIIKEYPNDDSSDVGKIGVGGAVDIICREDEWTEIQSADISGWVKTSSIVTGYDMEAYIIDNSEQFDRVATIGESGAEVLGSEGSDGQILAILKENDEVKVIREYEDYLYVKADQGYEGYIKKENVSDDQVEFNDAIEIESELEAISSDEIGYNPKSNYQSYIDLPYNPDTTNGYTPNDETEIRKSMVDYGMQFLGNPYVYGGTSMTNGVDCSAFVQNIYRNFGITLPRTAAEQSVCGVEIAQTDIRPGDLLFYWDSGKGKVGHVTMYIGNNHVVHASSPTNGIIVSNAYYRQPCAIRRIIND